jgi:hypothetical protein
MYFGSYVILGVAPTKNITMPSKEDFGNTVPGFSFNYRRTKASLVLQRWRGASTYPEGGQTPSTAREEELDSAGLVYQLELVLFQGDRL